MSEDNPLTLPLTSFEVALLADDRPAYPMTAFCRLRFSGFLDPTVFQAAVETVAQRHPFVGATIRRNWLGRLVWVVHPNWKPVIQWQANLNPSGLPPMQGFDLTQQPGHRWWVLERDDGHDVIIYGHHCCTDGAGINNLVEDLLVSYTLNMGGQDSNLALKPLNAQRLLRRGTPKLTVGKFLKLGLKQLRGLVGVQEFLSRSAVPLMGKYSRFSPATEPPNTFPAILECEFDKSETKKIKAAAKSLGVTVNMLLLRDLFLAIGAWRAKRGLDSGQDWLRIALPINLRGAADKAMPMANSVSMIFLDRQVDGFGSKTELLKTIYDQLWLIKRLQLQYTYIFTLRMVQLLPGLMSKMVQADKCNTSTYLSNLGEILTQTQLPRQNGRLVCGNVILQSVDIASFLRPHTNAGFMAYNYARRLRIVLHYDSQVMSADQATELLDMYQQQIYQTIVDNMT